MSGPGGDRRARPRRPGRRRCLKEPAARRHLGAPGRRAARVRPRRRPRRRRRRCRAVAGRRRRRRRHLQGRLQGRGPAGAGARPATTARRPASGRSTARPSAWSPAAARCGSWRPGRAGWSPPPASTPPTSPPTRWSCCPRTPTPPPAGCAPASRELLGVDVAVVVSDTFGRTWRDGLTDVAVGSAGHRRADRPTAAHVDAHGNRLETTQVALVDELASAADLVKGKLAGVPVAVVRGLRVRRAEPDPGTRPAGPPGPGRPVPLRQPRPGRPRAAGRRPAPARRRASRRSPRPSGSPARRCRSSRSCCASAARATAWSTSTCRTRATTTAAVNLGALRRRGPRAAARRGLAHPVGAGRHAGRHLTRREVVARDRRRLTGADSIALAHRAGDRPGRGHGQPAVPDHAGGQQAADAGLRQADGLLPAVDADDGRRPRGPGHHHPRRPATPSARCSATAAGSACGSSTPSSRGPRAWRRRS